MAAEQFEADEFDFQPYCLCPYDKDMYTNKQKKEIHKHCRQHLVDAVNDRAPEALLSLGADPTSAIIGRSTKITSVRGLGQVLSEFNLPLMPLLNPGAALRFPEQLPFLQSDVAAFARLVDAGYDPEKAGDIEAGEYEVIWDLQSLIDAKPELIAYDTETTGLAWFQPGVDVRSYRPELHKGKSFFQPKFQVLCHAFTIGPGKSYVLPWDMPGVSMPEADRPRIRNQLRQLLCDPETTVVGHNTQFDNTALWATTGIRFKIGGDSNMLAAIVDENAMSKDLASMVKIHVPHMAGYSDWFDQKYDKSRMWEVPWEDMIPYVGGDTIAAYDLYLKLEEIVMQDRGDWNHYNRVSVNGMNAMAAMEMRGMMVDDEEALPEFQEFLTHHVEEQHKKLISQIPKTILRKHVALPQFKNAPEKAISFTRPDFVRDILFTHPDGFKITPKVFTETTENLPDHMKVPSTSSKLHLPHFFTDYPWTWEYSEYVKHHDLLNKSIINFKNKYIFGGYVRPKYRLSKTKTRRTSSQDPNGQNFPKRGPMAIRYRRQFIAPEGYYVLEVDLSQAELRIAGDMANDRTIIEIYRTGGDIHVSTACIVLGVTLEQFKLLSKAEQKDGRSKAKAVNFGFIYGMGWKNFIGYAKTQYGVEFTENEAKRIRANFFKKYSGLLPWHDRMRDEARKNKMVRSYSGLSRHLPMIDSPDEGTQAEAGRQAINSPVQEFGSTLGVIALGRINEDIDPAYFQPVGFIHDAIVAYVKKEYVDWGMKLLKGYMESAPIKKWFGRDLKCPILAEAGFGLNLGEIYELPDFSLDEPYDFAASEHLKDKEGRPVLEVPPQRTPPNNGRLTRSPYTTPDDLEDETVIKAEPRRRMVRAAPTVRAAPKRLTVAAQEHSNVIRRSRPSSVSKH